MLSKYKPPLNKKDSSYFDGKNWFLLCPSCKKNKTYDNWVTFRRMRLRPICPCISCASKIKKSKPEVKSKCKTSLRKRIKNSGKSIVETHPELLKSWDYNKNNANPNEYSRGTNQLINWLCEKCGFSFIKSIKEKIKIGCVNCKKQIKAKLLKPKSLKCPKLNKHDLSYFDGKNWFIQCKMCNVDKIYNSWRSFLESRRKDKPCHKCANKIRLEIIRNKPKTKKHSKPLNWSCDICNAVNYYCANNFNYSKSKCTGCVAIEKYNSSVGFLNPRNLLSEWDYNKNTKSPFEYTTGVNNKVYWLCKNCDSSFYSSISNRVQFGHTCTYCSGRAVNHTNSLQAKSPELTAEWDYNKNEKTPNDYTNCSGFWVHWICKKCQHKYGATIANRTFNKSGCPKCKEPKKQKVWVDFLNITNITAKLTIQNKLIKPDGLKNNTIYEFNGDFWHGNPHKFVHNTINTINKKTFGKLYLDLLNRELFLIDNGFHVIPIWEKLYDQIISNYNSEEMRKRIFNYLASTKPKEKIELEINNLKKKINFS